MYWLVDAYRSHGHMNACLDPLGLASRSTAATSLDPQVHGLCDSSADLSSLVELLPGFASEGAGTVSEVVDYLEHMYCGNIALEAAHVSVSSC